MAVLGVGGVFIKSDNPDRTQAWYRDVLGVPINDYGGSDFLHRVSADAFPQAARTVFTRFPGDSEYFAPSALPFMINLIVDDLDAAIASIEAAGEALVQDPESYPYGRFAWVMDPDGVKVELWEPSEPSQ